MLSTLAKFPCYGWVHSITRQFNPHPSGCPWGGMGHDGGAHT